jgi:hypothetical protein
VPKPWDIRATSVPIYRSPVTSYEYFNVSSLRPFPVRNVKRTWAQFSAVTEIRLFELYHVRAGVDMFIGNPARQ